MKGQKSGYAKVLVSRIKVLNNRGQVGLVMLNASGTPMQPDKRA